jgi:putative ABC transport system permease protein
MRSLLRDLRYAARSLRKSPWLAVVATLALTLGIGLTTTMFSIVYAAVIKGLPFDAPEQLMIVFRDNPSRGIHRMWMPIHDFRDYTAQQRTFAGLGAYYSGTVNVSGAERAERFNGAWITANTFDLLRIRPILGRGFRAGEDRPGGERVAVIGYAMWRDRYASDPSIVGKSIRANGAPYTVIGVMPDKFAFPSTAQLWMPLQLDPLAIPRGEGQYVRAWGRLEAGVSIERAQADVAAIAKRLEAEYKKQNEGITAVVLPYVVGDLGDEPRRLLYTMLGAVFLVLLIACANVANLLLDRAAHRTKEVGIRTALGASRGAVVRQFLAEALVLALAGAALGLGVAKLGLGAFKGVIADTNPPSYLDFRLHPPVLLFVAGVAVLASLISGAIPAIQSSRADINEILKDDSRGASSFRIGKLSRGLVMFSIALSCGLLVAAGLMIKSVTKLRTLDPGFTTRNIFTARVGFPAGSIDSVKQRLFLEALEARLPLLPGVTAASLSDQLPGVGAEQTSYAVEGMSYATDRDYPETSVLTVVPGFFSTFDIRQTKGRVFTTADRVGSTPVVIVNQMLADNQFKGQDPIGRRIRFGRADSRDPWATIVGVVPNLYSGDFERPNMAMIYRPFAQNPPSFVSIAVRTTGAPLALTSAVRGLVTALDADIPIYNVYSMEEAFARPTWFIRVFGTMFMIFGFVALFLAAVGLYAVMAFSVSRRAREVGIRMALGAQGTHVLALIFRQGLTQLGVGMTFGLALAAGVAQLLSVILFDVQPRDPAVFASVVGVLVASGLLACFVPARRATRVDPMVAFRE